MSSIFGRRDRRSDDAPAPPHAGAAPPGADAQQWAPFTGPVPLPTAPVSVQRESTPAAPEAGARVLAGRYRIGELIGTGGMATVHAAHDQLLNRDVAVKLFRASAAASADLRLQEAEARNVASLNHYALTTLFDAGVDTSDPDAPQIYLVMERVIGTDLKTRLREGPLELSQVCWLGFDLAEGLDHVHLSGLLHRDIKPANVLLAERHAARRLRGKLADFGIAAIIGQPDMSEFTTGTAAYLSPEVVNGRDAVPASDVYSLGLILLEAITGKVEYPGSIETSAFARLDRDPHVPDTVPEKIAAILRGMTALEPEDRIALPDVALGFQEHLVDQLVAKRKLDPALLHDREAERVTALHRYDILDTSPDRTMDAITRLASRLLDTPIALVTLIDTDRVWFKSRVGWDEQQVDRDVAFCSTTNPGGSAPWTVDDAQIDPRTISNPLVTAGPKVRSYAGAPLITSDGHHLGSLCVFDRRPRQYTAEEIDSLTDLAELVMHEMELRTATRRALFSAD